MTMRKHKQQSSQAATPTADEARPRARARRATRNAKAPSDRGHARARGARGYELPAALFTTGLLGTAGYLFRRSVLHALKSATAETVKAIRATSELAADARQQVRASSDQFLHGIGLDPRASLLRSVAGPAVGVACGFIAGAVLTYFFAPQLLAQIGIVGTAENDVKTTVDAPKTAKVTPSVIADGILDHGARHHQG